jgi:hypothetical protein
MADILSFKPREPAPVATAVTEDSPPAPDVTDGPHMSGDIRCLQCAHTWVGVAPVGSGGFECPVCRMHKGVFTQLASRSDEDHYTCRCGSQYFSVTPKRVYCVCCGDTKRPYDEDRPRA